MAAASDSVWAIDIGNSSLKALRLNIADDAVQVIGFDNILHGKTLVAGSVSDDEKEELIALSLRRFLERNSVANEQIAISIPSQNSFARFVNLPPVEAKRIPEIVNFEAAQQIPFDINEVQWDWQLMTGDETTEQKVGIFAIKNEAVDSILDHFTREAVTVNFVQMTPMALYNYITYDRADLVASDTKATVVLNIGAENTDLVVCTKSSVWQRCIPMGGNAFTKAISDAFKLNPEKAEKLKRTAPMSKYARQILQAMKPIFTDLASEIQRSLGFYSSSNPSTKLSKIIAFGGGTKMRGLLKYLQQTLQIPIERPDSFSKLQLSGDISAAKFHEVVCDFGVVYGLGVQALGLAKIESNLLPRSIAKSMAWSAKSKYFIGASLLFLIVSILCLGRTNLDRINYSKKAPIRQKVSGVINSSQQAINKLNEQQSRAVESAAMISKAYETFKYRDAIPLLHQIIISALPNEKNNPEQKELYRAFNERRVEDVLKIPRNERKQIFITGVSVHFVDDVGSAELSGEETVRPITRRPAAAKVSTEPSIETIVGEERRAGRERKPGKKSSTKKPAVKRRSIPSRAAAGAATPVEEAVASEEGAGFVVIISGYSPSPLKALSELMMPIGVDETPGKWGFITRLIHLDDTVDGNSPFKLYAGPGSSHFKLEKGTVDVDSQEMPPGIGILSIKKGKLETTGKTRTKEKVEEFLIDPMTKEVISRVAKLDENGEHEVDRLNRKQYIDNDSWFTLSAKFVWRGAPKKE